MEPDRYVRRFDSKAERLVNPQGPAHVWGGQPVQQTGFILPYGHRGGYRQTFGSCGCGLGDDTDGKFSLSLIVLLGLGGLLAYTLLQAPKK